MAEISAKAVKELRERTGAGMMDCKRSLQDAAGDLERAVELLRERGLAKAVKREGRATSEGTIGMALSEAGGALVELGCETDFVAKTPDFQKLAAALAEAVVADASLDTPDTVLVADVEGETGELLIKGAMGRMGENIVLKRVARLSATDGTVGGYVHAGGKLGVIVGLRTKLAGSPLQTLAKDLAMHVAAADPTPVAVDRDGVPGELLERERGLFRRQAEQEGRPAQVIDRIVDGRVAKLMREICLLEQGFVKDPDRSVREVLEGACKQLGGEIAVTGFVRFKLGEAAEG